MAVDDLWRRKDGTPTARDGRGMRYRVRVDGYPTKLCRTRAEAERLNALRLVAGPPGARDISTVGEAVEAWKMGKRHLSPAGRDAVDMAAAYVLERWRDEAVADVTPGAVQRWLSGLTTSRGPASASLRHKVLQCMRGALEGRVDLASVSAGRERPREARFLTAGQLQQLAGFSGHYGPMVLFLGTTGVRLGECCALDVGDVDAGRRRARVRASKNGFGRDVPIAVSVLGLLDLERDPGQPLFTTLRGGRVDKDHWRARWWVPARDRLGVAGLRPHDLRHTAASLAIASGADVKAVQRMLGHKSATMTLDLYGHLFDAALDDVADRLEGLLCTPVVP